MCRRRSTTPPTRPPSVPAWRRSRPPITPSRESSRPWQRPGRYGRRPRRGVRRRWPLCADRSPQGDREAGPQAPAAGEGRPCRQGTGRPGSAGRWRLRRLEVVGQAGQPRLAGRASRRYGGTRARPPDIGRRQRPARPRPRGPGQAGRGGSGEARRSPLSPDAGHQHRCGAGDLRVSCPTALFHVERTGTAAPTAPGTTAEKARGGRRGSRPFTDSVRDDVCNGPPAQHPHRLSSPCALPRLHRSACTSSRTAPRSEPGLLWGAATTRVTVPGALTCPSICANKCNACEPDPVTQVTMDGQSGAYKNRPVAVKASGRSEVWSLGESNP